MAATCGNCNVSVSDGDVTCSHCGALLAAYASPAGSVTTVPEHSTPSYAAPPVVAEIVQGETAPEPLFDTHVTIEELVIAAESDHPVELLLAGVEIPQEPEVQSPAPAPGEDDVDGYPWPDPEPTAISGKPGPPVEVDSVRAGVGETEAYLRKLHKRAGYKVDSDALSAPVTSHRPTPADRAANRTARESAQRNRQPVTAIQIPGATRILGIIVIIFWAGVLLSALAGNASIPVVVFTVVLTLWLKMMTDKGRR